MTSLPYFRKSWIDIARGIGLLLVLYGHVLGSDETRFFIYSFHIPLFFFLSGMVFKEAHTLSFSRFIIKNAKQILIPYILFAFLTYIYWLRIIEPTEQHNILSDIQGIFLANGDFPHLEFNAPLWFLPCFFVTKVLYGFYLRLFNNKTMYIPLILSGITGYLFGRLLPDTQLPFSLEIAFTTVVFFGLGHQLRQHNTGRKVLQHKPLLLSIGLITLTYVLAFLNFTLSERQVDTRINQFNNIFLYYSASFSGIFSVIACSYGLRKNALLEFIGKKTMVLFVWHYPLYMTISKIIEPYKWSHEANIKVFFPFLFTIIALIVIFSFDYLWIRLRSIIAFRQTKPGK